MYTGEIQAMWSEIRLKEHGRMRQKPSLTEVQEKLQYVSGGVFLGGYLTVVDPEWWGWRYFEGGKAVRCVNTSPRNATTRGLDTVSSGGSPTVKSPPTSIDVSSKRPRPGSVITPTGERDHMVDEDDSVVSDDMPDMGEECDLHAATMPGVSLSEGLAVQQNLLQEEPSAI